MNRQLQHRVLLEIATLIVVLFQAEGWNAGMANANAGIHTVEAAKNGTQDRGGVQSTGSSNSGPSAILASMAPLMATHIVVLSWKASVPASNSPGDVIKGYIVYRSTVSSDRGALPIHAGFVPDTSCTDDLVEDGQTYFYVIRAVNRNGRISGPSNEAKAVIPKEPGPGHVSASPLPLCREVGKER